jgi:DNA modification methylase
MSRSPRPCPPIDRLRELLRYCDVAHTLYWRRRTGGEPADIRWNANVGDKPAGSFGQGWYRIEIDGRKYLLHRIIYKLVTGEEPPIGLRHADGDPQNNNFENLVAPDAAAVVQSGAERGDIWQIGPHRLMCGDATNPADVSALMGDRKAKGLFTSPNYLNQRDYGHGHQDWNTLMQGAFGDHLPVTADAQVLLNLGLIHRKNEIVEYERGWLDWMRGRGWRMFAKLIWDQMWGLPGGWNGRLGPSYEHIYHLNRQTRMPHRSMPKKPENIAPARRNIRNKYGVATFAATPLAGNNPDKISDNVIRINRETSRKWGAHKHPAIFPVKLGLHIINAYSNPGDLFYEPFAGSGTMIVAAHQSNRVCYAMELNAEYCALSVARIEAQTGLKAIKLAPVVPRAKPLPKPAIATVQHADMRKALESIPANSIDAVVTDPPYHLQSMVRKNTGNHSSYTRLSRRFLGMPWDSGDIAFQPETWKMLFRVMKPGAHLLAFAAPRKYGLLETAIRDAGFDVRDLVGWANGTGFPAGARDIGKSIDAELLFGRSNSTAIGDTNASRPGPGRVIDRSKNSGLMLASDKISVIRDSPATELGAQYAGYGSKLKNALVPICLARKPLSEGSLARNVRRWGTGGLNIDGCRITPRDAKEPGLGRWPTNLYLADPDLLAGHSHLFWSPKASAKERRGSEHPTIKPLLLMRELVRLVGFPGARILDPFAGSGTTGEACLLEGMVPILIERESQFVADIHARLADAAD